MLLTIITIGFNGTIVALALLGYMSAGQHCIVSSLSSMFFCLFNYCLFMFILGALTTFTEWNNIHSTAGKKIKYLFTFPFFMLTYIPIALVALFKKAKWKPMQPHDFGGRGGNEQSVSEVEGFNRRGRRKPVSLGPISAILPLQRVRQSE